jgi:DNA-binding NarL/FixJ family response regulator
MLERRKPVRSSDACELLPSPRLEGKLEPSQRAGKGASIVLIERQSLTRQCLSRWLQDGLPDRYIASIASPVDLLDASRSLNAPQIIIFSIGAASLQDPEVLSRINLLRRHLSRVPLVLLSDRDDLDDIVAAFGHGARGYISTGLEPSEAMAALECVAAGGTFVPPDTLIKLAQDRRHQSEQAGELDTGRLRRLTPRESEVLGRLRQGNPNKIIAHELGISENTVKDVVRRLLMKLEARNRTELACRMRDRVDSPGGS